MKSFLTNSFQKSAACAGNARCVQTGADGRSYLATCRAGQVFSKRNCQSGVGLIEVMVAVLVLSIAFLGIAALQAVSLSTSNSSMARSMATIASYSILDAMRVDSANAKAGIYNIPASAPIKTSACPAAGSTLQTYQVNQWCKQLAASLGASTTTTGAINCLASGNCTVTITFDDSRSGNNAAGSSTQQINTVAGL